MATSRVALTVQTQAGYPEAGTVLTQQASNVANGNMFDNGNGRKILIARNTAASSRTVQFSYVRRGVVVTQGTVALPNQQDIGIFGPFPAEMGTHVAADAADGFVYVTASGTAGEVVFAVLELPQIAPAAA